MPQHIHYGVRLFTSTMRQVLLTGCDIMESEGHQNFLHTLDSLLDMKMVPILNTNDVHSPPPQKNSDLKDVSPV